MFQVNLGWPVLFELIESLDAARCRRWEETTEQMNFTKSSCKSWALILRLGAAQNPPRTSERNPKNLEKDEGNCDRETRKGPKTGGKLPSSISA